MARPGKNGVIMNAEEPIIEELEPIEKVNVVLRATELGFLKPKKE